MSDKRISILKTQLATIESHIPNKDVINTSVSKSGIAWHLDHSLKVINGVLKVLKKTKPDKYKKELNFKRLVLFATEYVPRGKVKAPKVVHPPENVTTANLIKQINTGRENIEDARILEPKVHFRHFIFGTLSKDQTLRFLEIHTKHHLKIVKDILKKSESKMI